LRGNLKDPPTEEALQADTNRAEILAYRVGKLEVRDAAERAQFLLKEQEAKGIMADHAAIKGFSAPAKSSEPKTAAGGVFVPGEWEPGTPMGEDAENGGAGAGGGGGATEGGFEAESRDDIKAFYDAIQAEKDRKGGQ
jgi:hypothetical protein